MSGSFGYVVTSKQCVSIIKVNQTILFSENVWPVCLPSKYSTDENRLEKQQGIVVGYGPVDPSSDNPDLVLSSLPLQIKNSNVCNDRYVWDDKKLSDI